MPGHNCDEQVLLDLKGKIVGDDLNPPLECIVRGLSDTGARLVFSEPAEIPLEFTLEIPDERASARVRLIWGNGTLFEVAFTE